MSLPAGWAVRLRDDVEVLDDGALLIGGSPLTALRLAPAARAVLADPVVRDATSAAVLRRLLDADFAVPVLDGVVVDPADLTIVVPAHDRVGQLRATLDALGCSVDVLVVDDASRQAGEVARAVHDHGARLLRLEQNVGPAGARNAGLASVTTPYVAFVDSDVTATAGALLRLARHLADPQVAVVGPRVAGRLAGTGAPWFQRYDVAQPALAVGVDSGRVRPGTRLSWLPSACLVARVADLADGFDASMRMGEDVDLVWRLVANGRTVRYDATVTVAHDSRATFAGWFGRRFLYGTGGGALARRHGSAVAPAVLSPVSAGAAAAVLLRSRWAGPAVLLSTGLSLRVILRRLPPSAGGVRVAARLALRGLGWAVRQESALVLRDWVAFFLPAAFVSSKARRLVVAALVVDVVDVLARRRGDEPVGVLGQLAGRRTADLAYGLGLFAGSLRARSTGALLPRIVPTRREVDDRARARQDAENPSAEHPRIESPRVESRGGENPKAGNPKAGNPRVANPGAENPKAGNAGTENPRAKNPGAKNPGTENLARRVQDSRLLRSAAPARPRRSRQEGVTR